MKQRWICLLLPLKEHWMDSHVTLKYLMTLKFKITKKYETSSILSPLRYIFVPYVSHNNYPSHCKHECQNLLMVEPQPNIYNRFKLEDTVNTHLAMIPSTQSTILAPASMFWRPELCAPQKQNKALGNTLWYW